MHGIKLILVQNKQPSYLKFIRPFKCLAYQDYSRLLTQLDYKLRSFYYACPLYTFLEEETFQEGIDFHAPLLWGGNPIAGQQILNNSFTFLNRELHLSDQTRWEPKEADEFWITELHSFEWIKHLQALNTGEALLKARELIEDWANKYGHFKKNIWAPYTLSRRQSAFLTHAKWLLDGASPKFAEILTTLINRQANQLPKSIDWQGSGVVLFANIKALIYTGLCLPSRQSTFLESVALLKDQLQEQIFKDGCHIERSPFYHAKILLDLLDMHAIMLKASQTPPPQLDEAIDKMALALAFFRHLDGNLALFNDGATCIEGLEIDDLLKRCGLSDTIPSELPYGGFVRLHRGQMCLIMNAGTAAKDAPDTFAHADTLSFELSIGHEKVIMNSGSFSYLPKWRSVFRRTAAHNSITLNHDNTSELLAPFQLGRRTKKVTYSLKDVETMGIGVEAQDDSWRFKKAKHTRRIFMNDAGTDIRAEDVVSSSKEQLVHSYFHLHPDVTYQIKNKKVAILETGQGWKLEFRVSGGYLYDSDSLYAPVFGVKKDRRALVVRANWEKGKATIKWGLRFVKDK